MQWTRDQQVSLLVGATLLEAFAAELAIAAWMTPVEDALGWLFVALLLNIAVVQVLAERAGAGGPLRVLVRPRYP